MAAVLPLTLPQFSDFSSSTPIRCTISENCSYLITGRFRVMKTFLSALNRIWKDVLAGRNIEAYVVTVIGVLLVALGIVGEIDLDTGLTVSIAALSLLVYKSTSPQKIGLDLDAAFRTRESLEDPRDLIQSAHELWIFGASAVSVLEALWNRADKEKFFESGGKLKILLQNGVVERMLQR
jgi:hypothetical protein